MGSLSKGTHWECLLRGCYGMIDKMKRIAGLVLTALLGLDFLGLPRFVSTQGKIFAAPPPADADKQSPQPSPTVSAPPTFLPLPPDLPWPSATPLPSGNPAIPSPPISPPPSEPAPSSISPLIPTPPEDPQGFLTAKVSLPIEGDTIGFHLKVRGTAKGDQSDFSYYYLEMSPQGQNLAWTRIGPDRNKSVENSVLETAQLATFPEGVYALRLVVKGKGNQEAWDVVANLELAGKGSLKVKAPKTVEMSEITVSTVPQKSVGVIGKDSAKEGIEVDARRGSYAGWSLTGTFTYFVLSEDESIYIPVSQNLKVAPSAVTTLKGSPEGVVPGDEQTVLSPAEPVLLMTAQEDFGNGVYVQAVGIELNVPANPVAGSYQSTLTLTIQ